METSHLDQVFPLGSSTHARWVGKSVSDVDFELVREILHSHEECRATCSISA